MAKHYVVKKNMPKLLSVKAEESNVFLHENKINIKIQWVDSIATLGPSSLISYSPTVENVRQSTNDNLLALEMATALSFILFIMSFFVEGN